MNVKQIRSILKGASFIVSESQKEQIKLCYDFLKSYSQNKVIYGINTGFGPMAQYRIPDDKLTQLQYNIIRSHACGMGEPLSEMEVKAAMIARAQTFVQGKSGVHPDAVLLLQEFINRGICPFIPQHGSVGASGDLVQLSHMGLALIGEGDVFYKGQRRKSAEVFAETGLAPLKMHIREGLAIANGTAVMTGIGVVNLIHAERLFGWSVAASVLLNEIASSYDDFMAQELNDAKLHYGQQHVAKLMRELSAGSRRFLKREEKLYQKHEKEVFSHKVQPYYSLRCVPQILGPVLDTIRYSEKIVEQEINSVDDNPVVDPETGFVYHGGNFHGDYISFEMDKLKIAITKLTMLAERQINYLFNDRVNGILPPFVNMGVLGLNYGMQAAQFTATSTTAECQTLSNPMYVHSIPNNNDNQDIVSMGTNSALLTKRVIENAYQVMAIHWMALAQAVDCLNISDELSDFTRNIYYEIRRITPVITDDVPKYAEMEEVMNYLKSKDLEII